ncbi:MAG: hypothetical protein APR63_14240 [Desulfuromonas sp. SDB]|nr:MAG: hypothetical protein APR63_14240 [Desulfuromonas sp. SDB]
MKPVNELNLLNIITSIKNNRNIFLFNIIMIPTLILIISFIIPEQYTSSAMILSPEEHFDPLLYGFTGIGEGMSSSISKAILGGGAVSELWVTIIRSRTILLSVMDKFNLWDLWDIETQKGAIESMNKVIATTITPEGVIFLTVTTEDPKLSQNIATELIIQLDNTNQQLMQNYASNRKLFIENRLLMVKDSMQNLEDTIVKFSTNHGIFNIELEAEPMLLALSTIKSQEILLEAELAGLSSEQTAFHPQRRNIQNRLNSIKEQIKQIEIEGGEGFGLGFAVPLEDLPELAVEYARLQMDYLVQTEIYTLLVQEYERAKIAENKNTPTLKVIDWPHLPDEKSYPKRSIFLIVGVILGGFIGILMVLFKEKIQKDLSDLNYNQKIRNILYSWK